MFETTIDVSVYNDYMTVTTRDDMLMQHYTSVLNFKDEAVLEALKTMGFVHREEITKELVDDLKLLGYDQFLEKYGECDHEWISAKNKYITSGSICYKCMTMHRDEPERLNQRKNK